MNGEKAAAAMMNQIGTSQWIYLVDNCKNTVEELRKKGVKILMEPLTQPYGTQAIIADLYGNSLVLREPSK
jgi:predicted enzyme related to lactoylglutathione lyase